MQRRTAFDRLVTLALALVLAGSVWGAYQLGSRSGASAATCGALAAPAAAQSGTGYISVPAAAFVPEHYLVDYANLGSTLSLKTGASAAFLAPVHLPHGATVTKLTLNYYDEDSFNAITLDMWCSDQGGDKHIAGVTSGDDGIGSVSTTSISNPVVDNSACASYSVLSIGATGLTFYEAYIEFTYPTSYLPLMLSGQ